VDLSRKIQLSSNSDEKKEVEKLQQNIIPESDSDEGDPNHDMENEDNAIAGSSSAQPEDDAVVGTSYIQPEDAIASTSSTQSGAVSDRSMLVWKSVSNRRAQPALPCKGSLPPGPETPYPPINYFRSLMDDKILETTVEQTN
jgi:hypothetical protein